MTKLETVIKKMSNGFNTGDIKLGVEFTDVEKIPFSSMRLNYMTYGGIPVGRICEFSGADGSGKTTTALDLAGNIQKLYPDKKVVFCDIEHTFDSSWATKLGVNIEELVYYDPDTQDAEEVFQNLLDLMDTGEVSLCILDSLGAMVSGQENEKEVKERTYAGISQSLTRFSKKAIPICAKTKCIFLGINQIRDDLNSMYGGVVTIGGKAYRHNCTTRMSFRKGSYVDEKGNTLSRACENPVGNIVSVDLVKSKVCPPDRKVGFYTLNYMHGIDYVSDTVDLAIKEDIVHQSGAWFTIIDKDTGEILCDEDGNTMKWQGRPKLLDFLKENKNIYDKIVEQTSKSIAG